MVFLKRKGATAHDRRALPVRAAEELVQPRGGEARGAAEEHEGEEEQLHERAAAARGHLQRRLSCGRAFGYFFMHLNVFWYFSVYLNQFWYVLMYPIVF